MAVVQIGTTNRCNERCTFCPTPTLKRSRGTMEWSVFTSIVDNECVPEPDGIYVLCAFGEPLVDPQIVRRVGYTRQRRPRAEIFFHTNGMLLTPATVDQLVDAGLSRIVVSIYGFGPEAHKAVQPNGDWKTLVAHVNYSAMRLPTMVVGEIGNHEEAAAFWKSLGASVHFNALAEYGDSQIGPSVVSPISVCAFSAGNRSFDWDGSMVMCCMDFESKTTFGNARNETWDEAKKRVTSIPVFCETCALVGQLRDHLGVGV